MPSDAVNINEFYSPDSPLGKLAELLSPYIECIHTLYISYISIYIAHQSVLSIQLRGRAL